MTDTQKKELLLTIIAAATLPMELEAELIEFVSGGCSDREKYEAYEHGKAVMRRSIIRELKRMAGEVFGIQRAAYNAASDMAEKLEVV